MRLLLVTLFFCQTASAQQSQNPSLMVEHTRAQRRLAQQTPPGREKLEIGTLFIPAGVKSGAPILFFFHGGTWLPEVAGARDRVVIVSVQAGSGSATYVKLFENPARSPAPPKEAEDKAGMHSRSEERRVGTE